MLTLKILLHALSTQNLWNNDEGSAALLCLHQMADERKESFSWSIVRCAGLAGASLLLQPREAVPVFQALRLEKTWNRVHWEIYAASEDKRAHARRSCSPVSSLKSSSVSRVTSINYGDCFSLFNELRASFVW